MKHDLALLFAACLSLAIPGLTACAAHEPAPTPPVASAPQPAEVPEASANVPLEGTEWRLVSVGGHAVVTGRGDRIASVSFDRAAASIRGNSGLNSFFGPYTLDGSTLRIENVGMTRMAGPPELMDQEGAFVTALQSARSWRVHGDELELIDAAGATVASLRAVEPG